VGAVIAFWKARWKVPLKFDTYHRLHSAIVDYPPASGRLHLTVQQQDDKGDTFVSVRCIVEHRPSTFTKKLLTAVVDDCLAPALRGTEKSAVLNWLGARDYQRFDHGQAMTREVTTLERFNLMAEWTVDSMRISVVGPP
jgi:hypothetical protein